MADASLSVTLRPGETSQSLIERFVRASRRSGMAREMREREFFTPHSEQRRRARARARIRAQRSVDEEQF